MNKIALVMDDNENMREILKVLLEDIGISCDAVENGDKAIECYENKCNEQILYDFVILDWEIRNGKGGLETFQYLKKINPNVIAILCSGTFYEESQNDFVKIGFSAFLPKPFQFQDVASILDKIIKK